ncbi:MAG: DNA polymerase, partial [Fusobacteriaceae bacterium]
NSVIQGTASEIIKKAMVDIHKEIKKDSEIRLLLQVHDELIFEVEESVAEFWKGKMEDLMENAVKFENVKLSVNGTLGDNWAELK